MNKIAVVKFKDTPVHYEFKNPFDELEVGQKVVVDVRNALTIAEVVDFKSVSKIATKYIVQPIDLDAHKNRIEQEKKREQLEQQMKARKEDLARMKEYEELAANDEVMKKLLEEYKEEK
jgi:guanylate kinase